MQVNMSHMLIIETVEVHLMQLYNTRLHTGNTIKPFISGRSSILPIRLLVPGQIVPDSNIFIVEVRIYSQKPVHCTTSAQ